MGFQLSCVDTLSRALELLVVVVVVVVAAADWLLLLLSSGLALATRPDCALEQTGQTPPEGAQRRTGARLSLAGVVCRPLAQLARLEPARRVQHLAYLGLPGVEFGAR